MKKISISLEIYNYLKYDIVISFVQENSELKERISKLEHSRNWMEVEFNLLKCLYQTQNSPVPKSKKGQPI